MAIPSADNLAAYALLPRDFERKVIDCITSRLPGGIYLELLRGQEGTASYPLLLIPVRN